MTTAKEIAGIKDVDGATPRLSDGVRFGINEGECAGDTLKSRTYPIDLNP